jgi:hypothetical protein
MSQSGCCYQGWSFWPHQTGKSRNTVIKLKVLRPDNAFESGRAQERRVLGKFLLFYGVLGVS